MSRFWAKFLAGVAEYRQSTAEVLQKWTPGDLISPKMRKLIRNTYDASENWTVPPKTRPIFSFNAQTDITKWKLVDDRHIQGGGSSCRLSLLERADPVDPSKRIHSLVWEGELRPLPAPRVPAKLPFYAPKHMRETEFQNSDEPKPTHYPGFCGLVSPKEVHNLEFYGTISMQVQTDGRGYFFNVLPDTFAAGDDIYQAAIAPEEPRPMHSLEVDFDQLTQTSKGAIRYYQAELAIENIQGFSFGVQGEGSFRFELASMEAKVPDFDIAPEAIGESEEKTLAARLWSMFKPGVIPETPPDLEVTAYYQKKMAENKLQQANRDRWLEQEKIKKMGGQSITLHPKQPQNTTSEAGAKEIGHTPPKS